MDDYIKELKDEEKETFNSEVGAYDTEQKVDRHRCGPLIGGLVLIAIGTLFLLGNFTNFYIHNWWALFIMIPALGNLSSAWTSFLRNGRFTHHGRKSLFGGLILTIVASVFLFDLDWGVVWPVLLIVGGLGALFGGIFD